MRPDRFDWTVTGIDGARGRLVWGVECSWCGWTRPLPGVERLEPREQEVILRSETLAHESECPQEHAA